MEADAKKTYPPGTPRYMPAGIPKGDTLNSYRREGEKWRELINILIR